MPRGSKTDNVAISFDDEFKVRVLDADKFKQTQELEQECTQFVNSKWELHWILLRDSLFASIPLEIQDFNSTVRNLVEILDVQAKKIEVEKLKVAAKIAMFPFHSILRRGEILLCFPFKKFRQSDNEIAWKRRKKTGVLRRRVNIL